MSSSFTKEFASPIYETNSIVKVAVKTPDLSWNMEFQAETTIGQVCQGVEDLDLVVEEIAIKASPRWLAVGAARWNAKKKKRQHNTGEDSIA